MECQRTVVAGALALFASTALGAAPGFYFGVLGGRADYEFDEPAVARLILPPDVTPILPPGGVIGPPVVGGGVVVTPFRPGFWFPGKDDEATAFGALIGYRLTPHFAAELSYLDLGTLKVSDTLLIPPILGGGTNTLERKLETRGPSVSVLGILPVSDQWDVYLRAGVLFADMKLSNSINGEDLGSITFGSETLSWGAGTQFNWGDHWSVRLDFQRFDGIGDSPGEADIDLLSLGVLYRL